MEPIKAQNGQMVTEEMLDRWTDALDHDRWPQGERSVGKVVCGRPPLSAEGSTVLSVKVPIALKRALDAEARSEGISTSAYVRELLAVR